jgi:UDP-glucose 4-epimerase
MDLRPEYENRRIVVTGAAGFVGSHLVEALVAHGARVLAIDDFSDGRPENLAAVRSSIELVTRSVAHSDGLDDLIAGAHAVFHLAANASVPRSAERPEMDFESNVIGSHRVIEAVRRTKAGRIVFTSSAAVYGDPVREPMDESHPFAPKSPYGGSKLAAEHLIEANARCFGLDARRLRLFNTYGPRQRKYVMFDVLEKLRRDPANLVMLGSGEQARDYSYVADTVEAILLVGAHPQARGQVYNVAGEHPVGVKALVEMIVAVLGIPKPRVTFSGESWPGDVQRWLGDSSKLRALGFTPRTPLDAGLRALVDWHRATFHPAW